MAVTIDLPAHGLARGHVGTVVGLYGPDAVGVEFVDDDGRTYALATLPADRLLRLRFAATADAA